MYEKTTREHFIEEYYDIDAENYGKGNPDIFPAPWELQKFGLLERLLERAKFKLRQNPMGLWRFNRVGRAKGERRK